MTVETRRMTVEEFDQFVLLPENADKSFEYIAGEIVEVVSNSYCSIISGIIIRLLGAFVEQHKLGWVTTPDGGYMVAGERYIPDVAFISIAKYPKAPRETYIALPPDLAVEIVSPSDTESDIRVKLVNYLRAGSTVWVVNPDKQFVEVFVPGEAPKIVDIKGTLDGGDVLPGFTLAVKDIFPE